MINNTVLLSFDTEEFDLPREHGMDISLDEAVKVSTYGILKILGILSKNQVKATFFCTSIFAENAVDVIKRIIDDGHEVACHGCDHWLPAVTDPAKSKKIIESLFGIKCYGYRQPRMFPVDEEELFKNGYLYNSSLNPAFIPGRYMHLTTPRTCFMKNGLLQIPASVTPVSRIPLFWLSLHNFPQHLYNSLAYKVLKHDGYFTTYFHPWEFYGLKEHPEYKVPFIIKRNSGEAMCKRLDNLINMFKSKGAEFSTYTPFAIAKKAELEAPISR